MDLIGDAVIDVMDKTLTTAFAPLIGLPCWGVDRVHGSILSFEFGSPHLSIREPIVSISSSAKVRRLMAQRRVKPVGEWNLVIYDCRWRVFMVGEVLADDADTDERIEAAASALDGQKLTKFTLDTTTRTTAFIFDLGATLTTWPDTDNDEQWCLYQPGGHVISYRADGHYSSGLGTLKPDQEVWLQLECSVDLS